MHHPVKISSEGLLFADRNNFTYNFVSKGIHSLSQAIKKYTQHKRDNSIIENKALMDHPLLICSRGRIFNNQKCMRAFHSPFQMKSLLGFAISKAFLPASYPIFKQPLKINSKGQLFNEQKIMRYLYTPYIPLQITKLKLFK